MKKRPTPSQEAVEVYNGATPIPFYISVQDSSNKQTELYVDAIHDTGLSFNLRVYHDKVLKEAILIRLPHTAPGIISVQQGVQITISQSFFHMPEAVQLPMEFSLEQIQSGKAKDIALQPLVEVARKLPKLKFLRHFSNYFPVKVVAKDSTTGAFHYQDGTIREFSMAADKSLPTDVCPQEEIRRQLMYRLDHCGEPWSIKDYHCLQMDPCSLTTAPIPILGCIFGGAIGCGVCIFLAIMMAASEAG